VAPDLTAAQAGSSSRGWGMADRWAIYCRVSTRHQAEDGFSLDDQRAKLTDYAQQRGWDWELFEDAGRSGETLDDRPGMLAVLEAAERRAIVGVLVVDESRLARDELVAATIRSMLRDHGVKLASPGRGEFDLDDPSDAFTSSVLGAAHALEQAMRTAKMKAGLRRTAEAGFWPGGPPPFGYRIADDPEGSKHRVLAIDDQQLAALRRAFHLVVNDGLTVYAATPILNAEGFITQRGRPWRHENLCFQLRKPHLTGTWVYKHGNNPIEVQIPAILTDDEWNRLQSAIKGKPRPQRQNRRYPLTGRGRVHLRCSCGGNFYGKRDSGKKGRAYYECSRNKKEFADERCEFRPRIIQAVHLEELVWNEVVAILTDPDYLHALAAEVMDDTAVDDGDGVRGLNRRLDALRDERTAIVREKARSNHLDALDDALAQIDVEEATLKQQLTQAEQRQRLRTQRATVGQQIDAFVDTAQERMASPTVELMAQVFDLLDIDLVGIANHQFEGTGSIPIPEDGGEVWKEGPQRLTPRRSASRRWLRSGPESASSLCRGSLSSAMTCTRRRACSHGACRDTGAIPCPPSCAPKHRAARPCTAIRQGRTMSRIEGTAHNVGGPRA